MRKGRCFDGADYFRLYRLKSKTVRLTLEEIRFIEEYLPHKDFSYNLRSIIEKEICKTENPEKT